MQSDKVPVTIKKYANRRLYNTSSSAYVTLEDLAGMVKRGSDFVVTDAKSGEDITRSVLAQIIFEQEGKNGQSLLPITFLRQLIRFYGTGVQMLVPSFLEMSLANFAKEGGSSGQAFTNGGSSAGALPRRIFPHNPLSSAARPMLEQLEEQTRRNMAMFQQAMTMFTPFPPADAGNPAPGPAGPAREDEGQEDLVHGNASQNEPTEGDAARQGEVRSTDTRAIAADSLPEPSRAREVEAIRLQLGEMQRRLEALAGKDG